MYSKFLLSMLSTSLLIPHACFAMDKSYTHVNLASEIRDQQEAFKAIRKKITAAERAISLALNQNNKKEALLKAAESGLFEEAQSLTQDVDVFAQDAQGNPFINQLLKKAQAQLQYLESKRFYGDELRAEQAALTEMCRQAKLLVNYLNYVKHRPTIQNTLEPHLSPSIIAIVYSYVDDPEDCPEAASESSCLLM